MKGIKVYSVIPVLPERLKPLQELAGNLHFAWQPEIVELFRRLDLDLWEETNRNPVLLLARLSQERLRELSADEGFLAQMARALEEFKRYMNPYQTYSFGLEKPVDFTAVYFSAEFGLAECMAIYSGGLGMLAGDHLKSASDLNIPIAGIGLLYQEGYFRQYLNSEGWQQETYPDNDFYHLPLKLMRNEQDAPLTVEVEIKDHPVGIQIWKLSVGRGALYLLDTNLTSNRPEDRGITAQLYGGDKEMRIRQEIVLGIGGVRAIRALGIKPQVYHMNEGHSAFSNLERIRFMRQEGLTFDAALETVIASSAFTTHTPVPAGIDIFDPGLMEAYFGKFIHELGISMPVFLGLGRTNPWDKQEGFNMAVLALRTAAHCNGVSELHGRVSRRMWTKVYPEVPEEDIPISHITNGVHIPSWVSYEMGELFSHYLSPQWVEDPDNEKIWARVEQIPDSELWRTHVRHRERLIAFCRARLAEQLRRRGASLREVEAARGVLDPEALTIGFARRFALYKRAYLLFRNPERLSRILNDPKRPVQIIIAGKAHPADHAAKTFLRDLVQIARREEFRRRVVFIEDYDIKVAKYLVQGSDVWLNTPRRPLEACGTSGMKAVANGVLQLSVLDGWWAEGYRADNGWAIGRGEEYADEAYQDEVETAALYDLLEQDVVPLFYDREVDDMPRGWIRKIKTSMRTLCPVFNTHRMVDDYLHKLYVPAATHWRALTENNFAGARELAAWKQRVMFNWEKIKVQDVQVVEKPQWQIGEKLPVECRIFLGELNPKEISVDVYTGLLDAQDRFNSRMIFPLTPIRELEKGLYLYQAQVPLSVSGRFGLAIRVMPCHPHLANPYSMRLIIWA